MDCAINGHRIHYQIQGSGREAVVLLHHGLGSVQAWERQMPALAEAGFRVMAYDRWGYGLSEGRSCLSAPAFEEDIADLGALMDRLAIERGSLVGHSDGGTISLHFAARRPERVRCLVVTGAHIYIEPKMKAGIQSIRMAYEENERFRRGLRSLHGEKAERTYRNWFESWTKGENRGWDMRPVLGKITCPVLVAQGMEDEHATPQHARDLAEAIPGARLWLEPGADHMLPQKQFEAFNQHLIDFLKICSSYGRPDRREAYV